MIPVRNLVWFPSLRLTVLIIITLLIETGFVIAYCMLNQYAYNEIRNLALVVVVANLITGVMGWLIQNCRGLNA